MKIMNTVRNERGTVMMEYVVINFLFMVAIAIAGWFFVDPTGGIAGQATYDIDPGSGAITANSVRTTRQYGILGDAFMQRYNLMLQIVSMPYP